MQKTNAIFQLFKDNNVAENLFFAEKDFNFPTRSFAVFHHNGVQKTHRFSPREIYNFSLAIYHDDLGTLTEKAENAKNFITALNRQIIGNNVVMQDINFESLTFSQQKFESRTIEVATIIFNCTF